MLATAATVVAFAISVPFGDASWWRDNPMIHPVIATVAASITFWFTYPNRNLVKLWMAFAVITVIFVMFAIASGMPS